jgi:hypothetical protein
MMSSIYMTNSRRMACIGTDSLVMTLDLLVFQTRTLNPFLCNMMMTLIAFFIALSDLCTHSIRIRFLLCP